jgi:hypothetical protein
VRKFNLAIAAVLTCLAAVFGVAVSTPAFAQFNPSNGFSTINTQCGTYFLQGTTYYDGKGVSVGSALPFCGGSLSTQNSTSVLAIPAKFTNALLPTCNASSAGLVAIETDGAASPVYAATATGGGTLYVEVLCTNANGSFSWTNH